MRPDPTRPEAEHVVRLGGQRSTTPAWYAVTVEDGLPSFTCRVLLDDNDRALIAAGGHIEFTLHGGELPWSIGPVLEW